jgi:hypothetical protein
MGQRSQIIVLEKHYNCYANELAGKSEKIFVRAVYHNQWCYGGGFLSMLNDVLGAWNKALKANAKEKYSRMPSVANAIEYCNTKTFPDIRGYYDITSEGYKDKKTIKDVFKFCDNNNGFIVLLLDGDKLSYDIVSGTEDTKVNRRVTALQYLRLFYKTDDEIIRAKMEPAEIDKIVASISEAKRFNSFKVKLGGLDD